MNRGIIVVKVGTSTLSDTSGNLDVSYMDSLVAQVCELLKIDYKVILVTSGAIGAGMGLLGLRSRPKELTKLQACAAVGQNRLMRIYEESFNKRGLHTAQVLLTQDDFDNRKRFLNAKYTIMSLMEEFNTVPVINENDTVATEEIRFGDNDRLSCLLAGLVRAHMLIILTDVDGLYQSEEKRVIPLVTNISHEIEKMAHPTNAKLGRGGMSSKLKAAKACTQMGITCIIANGRTPDILIRIEKKEQLGTTFLPASLKTKGKKSWIAFSPNSVGSITIDDGGKIALISGNKSLLAAGIKSILGDFEAGDIVSVLSLQGDEFAKGVVNFSSKELNLIKGLKTQQIQERLGRHISFNEVIHRDNLVILR